VTLVLNKVKLLKVGSNAIVPVPVGAEPDKIRRRIRMVLACCFGLFSGVGSRVTGREANEEDGNERAGRSHGLPPIIRASWEARLEASYSHQMGGKEEASRERERERSKGPRPETPRMMNEDFVSKNASINLWSLVILSSHCVNHFESVNIDAL